MSRFSNLPPDMIKEISSYLPNRATRNAFRESNPYVEEVLGPKELYLTDLPPDILREINKKLDPRSKLAYRSSHPAIRGQTVSLKKQIKQLVEERIEEIYQTPVLLWTGEQEHLFEKLIEDMCKMYYGDDLKDVSFDSTCSKDIQYFSDVYVELKNKREKINIFLASGVGWMDHLRYNPVPQWFIDCTKNTDFWDYLIEDLYKIICRNVDNDYYEIFGAIAENDFEWAWEKFENQLKYNLTILLFIRDDVYFDETKEILIVEKKVNPDQNKIEVIVTYPETKEQFIFTSEQGKHRIRASESVFLPWLKINMFEDKNFWKALEMFIV
jgi:hypothetical protein